MPCIPLGGIAAPPPRAASGSGHCPPDRKSCALVLGCGDKRELISSFGSCKARCRGADQAVTGFIQIAEFTHFGHAHISVADYPQPSKSFHLMLTCCLYPLFDFRRWFAEPVTGQFIIIGARYINVNQCDLTSGQRYVFDILLQSFLNRYMVCLHGCATRRDTRNQTVFSCELKDRRMILKAYFNRLQ